MGFFQVGGMSEFLAGFPPVVKTLEFLAEYFHEGVSY